MELDQTTITEGNGDQQQEQQTPEKTFTQAEVNSIIADRLTRDGVHDNKEIVELLKDFGYEGTPAEIKVILREQAKEVKAQREQATREQELEDLQEQARETGTSPELLAEIRSLKAELADIKAESTAKKQEQQEQVAAQERMSKEINEFMEKYPDIDHDKLAANEKFNKFFKRSPVKMTLTEVYEDYIELIGDTEKAAIAKVKSNLSRSTASGKNKSSADTGGTYGLTARQQELAKDAGMSFKKFADHLSLIK